MYFYELHEGDDDVYSDVLLAHDNEFDEEEFLELVLEARREVIERFEEDSLVEAIANELERRHGFVHIDDSRLRVAVNVSADERETFVAQLDEARADGSDEDDEETTSFRTVFVVIEREDSWTH